MYSSKDVGEKAVAHTFSPKGEYEPKRHKNRLDKHTALLDIESMYFRFHSHKEPRFQVRQTVISRSCFNVLCGIGLCQKCMDKVVSGLDGGANFFRIQQVFLRNIKHNFHLYHVLPNAH